MSSAARAREILALKTLACALLSASLCPLLTACGQTPAVELKTTPTSSPQAPDRPNPQAPGKNSEGGTGTGETPSGAGSNPGTPGAGLPTRTRPLYRFACHGDGISWLPSFTSAASQTERPHSIFFDEFSRDGSNPTPASHLDVISRAVLLGMPTLDRLTAMMRTEYDESGALRPRIYAVDADLLYGQGHAVAIANVVEASNSAKALATDLALEGQLREFGGSSNGNYLLAPGGLNGRGSASSLSVFSFALKEGASASTLKSVGTLALQPSVNFFPSLDEESNTLSVFTYVVQTGTFANRFFVLENRAGAFALKGTLASTAPPSGETATGPAFALGEERWWMERSKSTARVARFDLKGRRLERYRLPLPADAQLFPQLAVVRLDGRTLIVTAVENIQRPSRTTSIGGNKGAVVKTAKFQIWSVETDALKAEGEIPYPTEVVEWITKNGFEDLQRPSRKFAALSLFATPDGREVYATLPATIGNKLFRVSTSGVTRLTEGQCPLASVVVDNVTPVPGF